MSAHPMAAPAGQLALATKRVLPAPRLVVYQAFSDPTEPARWWGPEGFTTPSLEFQARVGNSYPIEMQPRRATAST
jgi:uncharacterized protein YndB with AHSA1/START domain